LLWTVWHSFPMLQVSHFDFIRFKAVHLILAI